ncbi:hypothetical protein AB0M47_36050 [Hamadaea sp. NPDC051192]|uniref:hypothetical protein n=1 Tax=Hamadaea sp. NPDC051192 TaxID=3154940 RepID=UPI00344A0779
MTIRLTTHSSSGPVDFRPTGDPIKIYICGVTPYDAAHLGHVATFLTYDVLERRLHELGRQTTMVRNFTDLDEPILPRAQQLGIAYADLVEAEVRQFDNDMSELGMLPPHAQPRVSQMLDHVLEFIGQLDAAGYTYTADGTTYFDTSRSTVFGELSGYSAHLRHHLAAERGGNPDDPAKRSSQDFVLWRATRPGEPTFDSPYGSGVPGWHIGCSAMARATLGTTIDLHGGGTDLIFPHHECEQAQSLALQTEPYVGAWLHCHLVSYRGAKMSKSVGNIVLARNLLRQHDGAAIRLALLRQYRHTAGFEWRDSDITIGERLLDLLRTAARATSGPDPRPWAHRVRAAIDDDLDFPTAIAELEEMARTVLATAGNDTSCPAALTDVAKLLGIDLQEKA